MVKHSTQIDTINFVYNEMSSAESQNYIKDLSQNECKSSFFNEMIGLLSEMDSFLINPSNECIDRILIYARKSREANS